MRHGTYNLKLYKISAKDPNIMKFSTLLKQSWPEKEFSSLLLPGTHMKNDENAHVLD